MSKTVKIIPCDFFRFSFLWIILFGYYFTIRLPIIGSTMHLVYLIVLIMVSVNFKKSMRYICSIGKKNIIIFVFLCALIMISVSMRNYLYGYNDTTEYYKWYYVIYIIFDLIFITTFLVMNFTDIKEFCYVVTSMMLFQSIIAILFAFLVPVREFIRKYFYFSTIPFYPMFQYGSRSCGIALAFASGSICMFASLMLLTYCVINNIISEKFYFINYPVILLGTLLIGRTGFYLGMVLFFYYLFLSFCKSKVKVTTIKNIGWLFLIVMMIILVVNTVKPTIIPYYINAVAKIFGIITGQENALSEVGDMPVPQLTWETFWGTNILRGIGPTGIDVQNDSGYIKMYSAHGVPGSIIFYFIYLFILIMPLKKIKKSNRFFLLLCILLMFVTEYKEAFIMGRYFPLMIMVMEYFEINQKSMNKKMEILRKGIETESIWKN